MCSARQTVPRLPTSAALNSQHFFFLSYHFKSTACCCSLPANPVHKHSITPQSSLSLSVRKFLVYDRIWFTNRSERIQLKLLAPEYCTVPLVIFKAAHPNDIRIMALVNVVNMVRVSLHSDCCPSRFFLAYTLRATTNARTRWCFAPGSLIDVGTLPARVCSSICAALLGQGC
jgi:hypothetical protein